MFSSLRSRLWLSYVLVILGAMVLAALTLMIYLIRSPIAYRTSFDEMETARQAVQAAHPDLADLDSEILQQVLEDYDRDLGMRILIVTATRRVVADSRTGLAPVLTIPRLRGALRSSQLLRDEQGQAWLFVAEPLGQGRFLLVATPRPVAPLLAILRSDLLLPFVYAGSIALIVSLFISLWLARWIGDPLQKLVTASRQMPQAEPLPARGPREVQALTRALNDMARRVRASQQAQRQFVANVSHELKTPLTSISGFAQALQDGTAASPQARRQAAAIIQAESGRMHRMVVDLLDLARIDAGLLELTLAPVDLRALLEDVAEKFTPQAQAGGITIQVEAAPLPAISGDADRLAQVFTNLVDNALKFTPPGGRITLSAQAGAGEILAQVSDSGPGIPAEAQELIFERFYQADPSRPGGSDHGSGLGLSIVKEIILAHNGKINLQSAPGQGCTFRITLPQAPASAVASPKRRSR